MASMVICAAACVLHSARSRPRMSQIVLAFKEDVSLTDLIERIRLGHSNVYGSYGMIDYDTMQHIKEAHCTEKKKEKFKLRKIYKLATTDGYKQSDSSASCQLSTSC